MRAGVLAWTIAVLGIALNVAFHVLDLMNGHRAAPPIVGTFVDVAFLIVGALIASRRPRNPIGWIYLGALTLISFGGSGNVAGQYAYYALVTRPGSLPAPEWVLWAGAVLLVPAFSTLIFFSLLLFPDGRLRSPRWRPVAVAAVVAVAALTIWTALDPGRLSTAVVSVDNPVAVRIGVAAMLVGLAGIPLTLLTIVVLVASVAAIFSRFRAATGIERQQLKWFAYGVAMIPGVAVFAVGLSFVAPDGLPGLNRDNLWPLSVAGIPIATAVAILRYRLYDIDVLINRTLVYGATSAAIAAAFFGGIVVLQALLRPFTAGSEIAVAGSTLASVALFQPLRRRIQRAVDRRFYRSRYDAERTLDDFSVRLRDEVDLDALRSHLLDAVRTTMAPAQASLWLREPRR
jgi:hypothetical protein